MKTLKAGDTVRVYCEGCELEIEITLEPKANEVPPDQAPKIKEQLATHCPFCGTPGLEEC